MRPSISSGSRPATGGARGATCNAAVMQEMQQRRRQRAGSTRHPAMRPAASWACLLALLLALVAPSHQSRDAPGSSLPAAAIGRRLAAPVPGRLLPTLTKFADHDLYYLKPDSPRGLVIILHKCGRTATDYFPWSREEVCHNCMGTGSTRRRRAVLYRCICNWAGCLRGGVPGSVAAPDRCACTAALPLHILLASLSAAGLPNALAKTKQVLARGYVAAAMSSRDRNRETRCFEWSRDADAVAQAVQQLPGMLGLPPGAPVYLDGVSSGGSVALRLPSRYNITVAGVIGGGCACGAPVSRRLVPAVMAPQYARRMLPLPPPLPCLPRVATPRRCRRRRRGDWSERPAGAAGRDGELGAQDAALPVHRHA